MGNVFTKIFSIIKIIRPLNFLIAFLSTVVGAIICISGDYSINNILFAAISASLIISSGNMINDIFDIESDKINHPERPLPKGTLSKNHVILLLIIFNLIALILAFQINFIAFAIAFTAVVLLFLYSYKIKRIPFLGNIIVALLTGMVFIYAGVSVNNYLYAVIPAVFAFLINLIRELVKDMEDIEGDKSANVFTLPQRIGFNNIKKIILLFSILLILFTTYPFLLSIYRIEYFIFVMIVVNPILVFILKSVYANDSKKNLNKLSFLLKLDMLFGLIAIYLGK